MRPHGQLLLPEVRNPKPGGGPVLFQVRSGAFRGPPTEPSSTSSSRLKSSSLGPCCCPSTAEEIANHPYHRNRSCCGSCRRFGRPVGRGNFQFEQFLGIWEYAANHHYRVHVHPRLHGDDIRLPWLFLHLR